MTEERCMVWGFVVVIGVLLYLSWSDGTLYQMF